MAELCRRTRGGRCMKERLGCISLSTSPFDWYRRRSAYEDLHLIEALHAMLATIFWSERVQAWRRRPMMVVY